MEDVGGFIHIKVWRSASQRPSMTVLWKYTRKAPSCGANYSSVPDSVPDCTPFTTRLAAGGDGTHNFHSAPVGKAHRPIDVLYRSSNCTPWPEALATKLRRALERGLRFVATGRCKDVL